MLAEWDIDSNLKVGNYDLIFLLRIKGIGKITSIAVYRQAFLTNINYKGKKVSSELP